MDVVLIIKGSIETKMPIKLYFNNLVSIMPDFIFPLILFDTSNRKMNNLPTPLTSKIKPSYDTPGAYVFFEPCNQNNEIEIMYVGRSKTLRDRIGSHWNNYTSKYDEKNIIQEWFNYCWDNNFPYCPYVAIFISFGNLQELKDLEHWLMQLKPKLNTH